MNAHQINLPTRLDGIWQSPATRSHQSGRELQQLDSMSALVLGAWAFAAAGLGTAGSIKFLFPSCAAISDLAGNDLFNVNNVGKEGASGHRHAFVINDSNTVFADPEPQSLSVLAGIQSSNLLTAMELIRDHLDSTFFLPREIRAERLKSFAEIAGVPTDLFEKLVAWYPQIEHFTRKP